MKKGRKKYIVGACFVGVGLIMVLIAYSIGGIGLMWDWDGVMIDWDGVHYYSGSEKLQTEGENIMANDLKKLNMDIEYGDVIIQTGDVPDVKITTRNIVEKRFSYEVSGDTLNIKYKGGFSFFTWKSDAHVYVTLPEGTKFEKSDISNGAGRLQLAGFSSDIVKIDNGAGELSMKNMTVNNELTVKSGAGSVRMENVSCGYLDVDSGVGEVRAEDVICSGMKLSNGMGSVRYTGEINGSAKIDNGVGEVRMTVYGLSSDYNFDVDNGIGQVKINGNAPVNTTGGKYDFKIDTGIGEVRVDVKEKQ